MAEIDFKAYTTRALELESAIYTQRKLMAVHGAILKEQEPVPPKKEEISKPAAPERQRNTVIKNGSTGMAILTAVFIVTGVIGILGLFIGQILLSILPLIMGGLGVKMVMEFREENKAYNLMQETIEKEYKEAQAEYPKLLEIYEKEVNRVEKQHQAAMIAYKNAVNNYKMESTSVKRKHIEALESLEAALKNLYDENVIFPKYRNLVAISAINEYLVSGRCYELEGPNGAYNLYEMELRQNIVIEQLNTIISNLEQIRNNQFSLYRELVRANDTVEQIVYELRDLRKTTKLAAYFAGVSAKAAVSPKYYKGFIH